MEERGGAPGAGVKLEAAGEMEHGDAEESKGIPVGEGGKNGPAPGDLLSEVEVGREGKGDSRPEENEDGPAKSKFVCDDDWAIHSVRAAAAMADLRFCGWIKTALIGENNDEYAGGKIDRSRFAGRAGHEH